MKTPGLILSLFGAMVLLTQAVVAQDKTMQNTTMVRSSQVVGMEVHNTSNQNLGRIEEVVFDRNRGTIGYVVVAPAGADAGSKLVAVPWDALKKQGDDKTFVVDVANDKWAKAPTFEKSTWPDFTDSKWSSEVTAFYGTTGRDMREDTARGLGDRIRDRVEDRNRDMKQETVTYSGTVKSFNRSDPAQLVLDTDKGEVNASLGPNAFLDEQKLTFDQGSRVSIRGYELTRDGRKTFVATEYTTPDGRTIQFRQSDRFADRRDDRMDRNRDVAMGDREAKRFVTYSGAIRSFNRSDPATIVITTDRGDLQADLGPASFLDEQHLAFDQGTRVAVRGYEIMRDGRRTFIATEYTSPDGRLIRLRKNEGEVAWSGDAMRPTDDRRDDRRTDDRSNVREIEGTVTYVENGGCESPDGRLAYIRTQNGDQVVILGPGEYLDRNNWSLRNNDTIKVRGYDYDSHGRRYFMANEVRLGNNTWTLRGPDGQPAWRR